MEGAKESSTAAATGRNQSCEGGIMTERMAYNRARKFEPFRMVGRMLLAQTWGQRVLNIALTLVVLVHLYAWLLVLAGVADIMERG
jgi:hypothetical protein